MRQLQLREKERQRARRLEEAREAANVAKTIIASPDSRQCAATYGCSLGHIRLQPRPPTVAASATYGCSLHHIRLQAVRRAARGGGGSGHVPG